MALAADCYGAVLTVMVRPFDLFLNSHVWFFSRIINYICFVLFLICHVGFFSRIINYICFGQRFCWAAPLWSGYMALAADCYGAVLAVMVRPFDLFFDFSCGVH